jgi:hypothetical protein
MVRDQRLAIAVGLAGVLALCGWWAWPASSLAPNDALWALLGALGGSALSGAMLLTAWTASRTIWQLRDQPYDDWPELCVLVTARRLAAAHGEWGQAMLAELHYIEPPAERWRFALGCVWVALFPPRAEGGSAGSLPVPMTLAIVSGAAVCLLSSVHNARHSALAPLLGLLALAAVLAVYLVITLAVSRPGRPKRS